jgi:Ca2+/Na+ antiporter
MSVQELGPILVGVVILGLFFLVALALGIVAIAGLLNKKANHFEAATYLFLVLGLVGLVIYSILSNPLTKEVLSDLF